MVKRAKFGIWINDKDKRLFNYLFEHKVALASQINRDIYQYDRHQTLYNRLGKLEDLGFIQASYDKAHKRKKIFSIAFKTFKDYVAIGGEKVIELKSESAAHDLDLVDIRHSLRRASRVGDYLTENILQAHDGHPFSAENLSRLAWHSPDALLNLKFPDGDVWCVLEYEASLRYKQRAMEFFNKYHRDQSTCLVLVVTKTIDIRRRLEKYNRRACGDQCVERYCKFFFTTLDDLRQGNLAFDNVQGRRVNLMPKESGGMTEDHANGRKFVGSGISQENAP